jgi:hypothetical protein
MAMLSREDIFAAKDLKYMDLDVPEWGGSVRIKMLTGAERDEFEASTVKMGKGNKPEQNLANLRARLVSLCLVDEDNTKLFAKQDIGHLGQKSAAALERVFKACQEHNAMTEQDIEDLTEGFSEGQSESSTSA